MPGLYRVITGCWLLAFFGSCAANAHTEGSVTLQGSIIETPCAIDTQSRDQSIDMGIAPVSAVARDGQGLARPFSIYLVNCTLKHLDPTQPWWRYFQVTFDGDENNGLFGVSGDARGIDLKLADANGRVAHPGVPLPAMTLVNGENQLNYTLRLVRNNQLLRAGQYSTAIRFKMDYY